MFRRVPTSLCRFFEIRKRSCILCPIAVLVLISLTGCATTPYEKAARRAKAIGTHSTDALLDVDRDGENERFYYSLEPAGGNLYTGNLTIIRGVDDTIWTHEWMMTIKDLESMLFVIGTDLKSWTRDFFRGPENYGAELSHRALSLEELQPTLIEANAADLGLSVEELTGLILSQEENVLFWYRATWREDVVELVYLPTLNKFIRYGWGPY